MAYPAYSTAAVVLCEKEKNIIVEALELLKPSLEKQLKAAKLISKEAPTLDEMLIEDLGVVNDLLDKLDK